MRIAFSIYLLLFVAGPNRATGQPFELPRCQVVPLPGDQVSLQIEGVEKLRWHLGTDYPRPFFYPLSGPSGAPLTRMGHPGAQNHDHHRSIWFAHHNVAGENFWTEQTDARVWQKHWYRYRDGDDEAVMAVACGWYDGDGRELMQQDLVAALIPLGQDEHALELQITLRPAKGAASVELGKTNFGFLAVRVAKSISAHFGGGRLTNSEDAVGEPDIFGNRARWVDYSGPVAVGQRSERKTVTEGITYFDHPDNPRYPAHWHVRVDGWMGAAFCMHESYTIAKDEPLVLRYLLHAHSGGYDASGAKEVHKAFSDRPGFIIRKATEPHRQYEVERSREN